MEVQIQRLVVLQKLKFNLLRGISLFTLFCINEEARSSLRKPSEALLWSMTKSEISIGQFLVPPLHRKEQVRL